MNPSQAPDRTAPEAPPDPSPAAGEQGRRSRLNGYFERMADSRWAVPMLGLLSFLDACVSPILPEVLLVPLCLGRPKHRWFYAVWSSVTSVVGAVAGYWLGMTLWEAGLREFAFENLPGFTPETFAEVTQRYGSHAFLWIVLAAFTPLPFKLFTVAAGVCHDAVPMATLIGAAIVGRFPRFWLEVLLIHRYGQPVLDLFRRNRWTIMIATAAVVVVILLL